MGGIGRNRDYRKTCVITCYKFDNWGLEELVRKNLPLV